MALNPLSLALRLTLAPVRLAGRLASNLAGGGAQPQAPPPRGGAKALDDVAIARKVESIIFRDRKIAKGKVDVNVVDGVVWLRGEVATPERIDRVESLARGIPEVRGVENLLHLPKAPVRTRPGGARRRPAPRKVASGKVTAEGPAPVKAEPSPRATAAAGKGRRPAPLGSKGGEREADGPDTADLDKDPAYNPPPGLRDIKGG